MEIALFWLGVIRPFRLVLFSHPTATEAKQGPEELKAKPTFCINAF